MKAFYLLLCLATSQAVPYNKEWKLFKTIHGKKYGTAAEEQYRMKVFYKNNQMIEEHNRRYEQGIETFTMGMNKFGDLTHNEFNALMNRLTYNQTSRTSFGSTFVPTSGLELPSLVDWRKKGAVTAVKNQQHCGSCYAFSALGALEGQHFIKHGRLVSLSEQQIVDCANSGCNGGDMDQVFDYIKNNQGVDTERSYPYTAEEDTCKFSRRDVETTDNGYVDISTGDEEALQEAVAVVGPVSVGIDASRSSFQFYTGGVYLDHHCSSEALNHGVLTVGYGKEGSMDYWLVKNSWGPEWGMGGYIKMAKNKANHCGIASRASYPTV